ncbi:32881_t:CDS:2, partial [Gigaspora margarita]
SATLANYRLYSTSEILEEVVRKDTNKATNKATNKIINKAIDNKATDKATNEITIEAIDTKASLQDLQDINLEKTLFTTEQSEQDSISYSLVFDTDSSDDESAVGNFLSNISRKKALVFEEDILSQKWKMSRATDYKWKVNRNLSKNTSIITFTTIVDEHNYSIVPSSSTTIAKYYKLGEDMVEFIKFCIHHGVTSAQSIGCLLKGKFSKERTQLVAIALLEDKTESSFVWAFSTIKKCMEGLIPKVVFTDSDPAITSAISLEFPNSIHSIATNVYNELIGIYYKFILDKWESDAEMNNIEYNIMNSIITAQREQLPGRAKSSIEIEDQHIKKKQCLLTEVSNQIINETDKNGDKDKRKTCQNCLQKEYNKATCNLAKAG